MTLRAPVEVAFGLGSNMGDKAGLIRDAAARLERCGLVQDLVLSSLYRTAPWGHVTDQDWFVNACAWGYTRLAPVDLLRHIKSLEQQIGRTPTVRWGPRLIDIDILYYGDHQLTSPELTLPHRELLNRAFVLVPLAEIRPGRTVAGSTLPEAIGRLGDQGIVRL